VSLVIRGEDRMSKLERRCRLLLTAYPAEYRRERGEEILGTLLETTLLGRNWPRAAVRHSAGCGRARALAAARPPGSALIHRPGPALVQQREETSTVTNPWQ
jgi:hypothetical protein